MKAPAPRRLRRWWFGALAVALIASAACTGTFEEGTPLVLLVANGADGEASQVFAFLAEPPGRATPRQAVPLGSGDLAPDLTLPLRAWDWVDREAVAAGPGRGRSRLVALASATATALGERSALLHRYDVGAADLDAPRLTPVDSAPFTLVREGRWDVDAFPPALGVQLPVDGVCLTDLAVSQDGRHVALLDRRATCRSGETVVGLHVIDVVQAALVWSSTPNDVAPTRPLLDQRASTLDVWERTPDGYGWYRLDLATMTRSGRLQDVSGSAFVDATPADDDRWVLIDAHLRVVTGETPGTPGESSASGTDRRFVDTGPGLPVVIIGSNLVVHPSPTQAAASPFGRRYVDGTTDVPDQLTYLVRVGAIDALDLLLLDPGRSLPEVISEIYRDPVGDALLTQPRRVTWFRPRPPPVP
jgi:hypothetical protein